MCFFDPPIPFWFLVWETKKKELNLHCKIMEREVIHDPIITDYLQDEF